MMKASADCITR